MKRLLPENLEKHLITALLAAMAFFMLCAAFCRHLWPQAHNWPLKTAGGCLAWMASFGMSRAAALGVHIKVSFIETMSGKKTRRILSRVADSAYLLFSFVSLTLGCAVFVRSLAGDNIPSHPVIYAAIPVGSVLTILRLTERLGADWKETEQ